MFLGWAKVMIGIKTSLNFVRGGEAADSVASLIYNLEDAAMYGLFSHHPEHGLKNTIFLGLADEG